MCMFNFVWICPLFYSITYVICTTVIHLQRLKHLIGIKGTTLDWFESYFSDRSQSVFVNDESSMHIIVIYGVAQGSVLGPLLFSL